MIEMSAQDLNRTYEGTYVGLHRDGKILPLYVHECLRDNMLRASVFNGSYREDAVEYDINSPEVHLHFPDSGVYTYSDTHAVYIARRTERQWHRGIRERALVITGDVRFDPQMVYGMFNPKYSTWEDVHNADWTKTNSFALNRNLWVHKQHGAKYPLLRFRERVVGELRDGNVPDVSSNKFKTFFEEVGCVFA